MASSASRQDCVRSKFSTARSLNALLQDLHGVAHKLPLMHDALKLTVAEMKWLVKASLEVKRSCSVIGPSLKRSLEAADLEDVVKSMPVDSQNLGLTVCGPAKAAKRLTLSLDDCDEWLAKSRVAAIAGSCPRSHAEIRSSVRAYAAFALRIGKPALPPSVDILLSWSCLFRCSGTFKNYLCNVRTACQVACIPTDEMSNALISKAIRAIDKRRGYIARKPMFIGFDVLQQMVSAIGPRPTARVEAIAMAFLTTYVFLLRMPSECLPIMVADGCTGAQAIMTVHDDCLVLQLRRRKNKDGGSVLKRGCWCNKCRLTCPVHVLGKYFRSCPKASHPFAGFCARSALAILRGWLKHFNVAEASMYRTHDLRRGHARDMARSGSRLHEILAAGEWKSAAFMSYQDKVELECEATMQCHLRAHLDESSDEDDEGGQVHQ